MGRLKIGRTLLGWSRSGAIELQMESRSAKSSSDASYEAVIQERRECNNVVLDPKLQNGQRQEYNARNRQVQYSRIQYLPRTLQAAPSFGD